MNSNTISTKLGNAQPSNMVKVMYEYKMKSILENEQTAIESLEEYQNSRLDPNSDICKIERMERASKSFLPNT